MKKLILLILCLLISGIAFADKIIIPGNCYPKQIQKEFKKKGIKLDLSGNERNKKSWGFLVNEGSQFTIYTYKGLSTEDLKMVYEIWRHADEYNSFRINNKNKKKS